MTISGDTNLRSIEFIFANDFDCYRSQISKRREYNNTNMNLRLSFQKIFPLLYIRSRKRHYEKQSDMITGPSAEQTHSPIFSRSL